MAQPIFRTRPGDGLALIESWIGNPVLRDLVEADGGRWPTGSLGEVVDQLVEFSATWDTRSGRSRLLFKEGNEPLDDARAERIYQAARDLGLLDSTPPTLSHVDYLLVLGGLATGVEPRMRYAAELIESGKVATDTVVALGSFRQVDPRERPAAERYAPKAEFEIDLLEGIARETLGDRPVETLRRSGDPAAQPSTAELVLKLAGSPPALLYAARSSAPESRPANTADTYQQFADDVALASGDRILIVTSAIYRPYQHLDAVRMLGAHGAEIETVGPPRGAARPTQPPSAYLQEIRSTLRSAQLLFQAGLR